MNEQRISEKIATEIFHEGSRVARDISAAKWGFDLTSMRASDFAKVLQSVGCSTRGVDTGRGWMWKGSGILVMTANNPITGEYSPAGRRQIEKDYLSYVGIEGNPDKVKIVADGIRSLASYTKDESPEARDYI